MGYRLFKKSLLILGFLVGAICGMVIISAFSITLPFILIGMLIGGLLGAFLFKKVDFAVFLVLGGLLGSMLGQILAHNMPQFPQWIIIAVFTVIIAIIAVLIKRPIIIAATALIGAVFLVMGTVQLITGADAMNAIESGKITQTNAIIILITALFGAVIQIVRYKSKK